MNLARIERLASWTPLLLAVAFPALAETAGGDADEHGAGHGGGFPVWEIFNFLVLIGVLVYFARKPVLEYFAERRSEIKGDIDAAAALLEQAEQRNSELQRRLADLHGELEEIRVTARQRAEEEYERIVAEAHEAAEHIQRDAVASVDQELRRAKTELREEAASLATDLAEQILSQQVGEPDRDRLMDEFISRVESTAAGRNGEA